MKLNLNIRDKHIIQGEQSNPQNCAIARALKDKIGNIQKVGVFPNFAYLVLKRRNKSKAYKAKLNKKAESFIKRFDDGKAVNAFKFNISFREMSDAKELI